MVGERNEATVIVVVAAAFM